jgi:hypothetical protein
MLILRYDSSTDLDAIAQEAGYRKRMPKHLWLNQFTHCSSLWKGTTYRSVVDRIPSIKTQFAKTKVGMLMRQTNERTFSIR